MKIPIRQATVLVLGACLLFGAASADARPPGARNGAVRWQAGPALERILAQARMSNAERERLRRDLSATPRGRGGSAQRNRMTPKQRESLRRDLRDANRQLDRNRGGNGKKRGNRNGKRRRGRR